MEMLLNVLALIGGLLALYYGSEFLVQGSSRVAAAFGVQPIVIGLTLVAFGTSSPELVVSVLAVFQDHPEICIGNIVGSNIANIGLILGTAALIKPNKIDPRVIKFDMPLVAGISVIFWIISLDGNLQRIDGVIFVGAVIVYLIHAFRSKMSQDINPDLLNEQQSRSKVFNLMLAGGGLIILVIGGQLLVYGAINIARAFGVSELIIGLSIVAIGTSLPELATTVYATATDKGDISIGNIVGSNLFNILFVIGIVSLLTPLSVDKQTISWDMPVMLGFTFFIFLLILWKRSIGRIAGVILLLGYVAYIGHLYFG